MEVSCIILAGGKSERMKKDKAFLLLNKKPLIGYALKIAKKFFSDVVVVVKNSKQRKKLEKIAKKVKVVEDGSKIYSPIAGIKEGVKHVKNDYIFVLACDMPFVDEKTIRELLVRTKEGVECIAYFWSLNKYEPLCAIYRKKFFDNLSLKESMSDLIKRTENKVLIPIARETNVFFNINTGKDLEIAKKLVD